MSLIKSARLSLQNIHFQSLLGNGIMAGLGMVTQGMLFRALSIYDLGVYVLFMVLYTLADTLKTGFLTNPFITFYTGVAKERADAIAGSTWALALIISFGLIIVNIPTYFIALHMGNNDGTALYLKCFSIMAISTVPTFMSTLIVQGEKRFDRLFWLRLINQVLYMIWIAVLMFIKKTDITSVLIGFTATNFLASAIIMPLGWTGFSSIKYANKETITEIYHFGKYAVGTSISTNLFRVTDTFFINYYLGAPLLAVYYLGGRWMQIVEIPIMSFASSGMPVLADLYNKNQHEEVMLTMKKLIGMLSIGVFIIAVLAIIFANPLILLLGGAKYAQSNVPANLFRIFISIAVLFPADRFFAIMLDVAKKPKVNFYKILIMLAANLITDFIGVSIFKSVYAVVINNIFPVLIAIIISYIALQKYTKFSFWNIYIVGYKEAKILVKNIYNTIFSKASTTE